MRTDEKPQYLQIGIYAFLTIFVQNEHKEDRRWTTKY